jgi:ferredoxin
MVIITLQRNKCIGCNYCVEVAPQQFTMSQKDGKSILINAYERKGFFTLKEPNNEIYEQVEEAAELCPAKIISVKIK